MYRSGAVDSLPGLDALGQYALDFPTKVRENPRLLSFQVGGYDAAFPLGKADKAPALDTAFSALDQLARLYDGTATIASGLDYIKFHPQQFPNFPQNQLIALENQAEDLSSRIKTAAQGLRSNPFSVSDLDPGLRDQMNSLDARLPARLQLIPKLPKISVVTFGAHGNDSMTPGGYGSQPQARVEVPSGYKIIGGGACARNPAPGSSGSFLKSNGGQFLTACLPLLNPQQWLAKSKDHFTNCKGEIDAWAITIQDPNDIWDVRIERKTFGPSKSNSGRVELPPGYLLTGGGACAGLTETREGDFTNNTLLKASYPEGNAWVARSKDHMHEWSAHLTVCVIGIKLRASTLLPESKLFVGSPQTGEANFNFVVVPDEYQVTCGGFNVEAVAGDQWHVEHLVIPSYPWADPNLFPGTRWMVESKWSDVQLAASITPYAIGIKKT